MSRPNKPKKPPSHARAAQDTHPEALEPRSRNKPTGADGFELKTNKRGEKGRAGGAPREKGGSAPVAHVSTNKIAGLSSVSSLFRHDPRRVLRLYFCESMKLAAGPFCAHMARLHRPYRMVSSEELNHIAGTVLHGGIVAAAQPRVVADLDWTEAAQWAARGEPLFILDGVGNPHNLGAIARTLAFFGLKRLIVSDHPAQAGLSDAAYRVAEGGLEVVHLYRMGHLPKVLKHLQRSFRVVGTSLKADATPIAELPPDSRPLAVLLGNEEHGLPPQTLAACEVEVTIPGGGELQSLNVSASAAILIYEMTRTVRRAIV